MKNYSFRKLISLVLVLFMIFSSLPLIGAKKVHAAGSKSGIFAGKYGVAQIFDCLRTPPYPEAGKSFWIHGFSNIYDSTTRDRVDWGAQQDRYVQFEDSAVQGSSMYKEAYLVKLNLYESDGTLVKTISDWGTVWALGDAGFFYEGHDHFGYFISNNRGYSYGSEVTYTPSTGLITNIEELNNYSATTAVLPSGKGVPGAPTGVSAVAGDGQATVSFTEPTDDGGSQITGYEVTSKPGGLTTSVNGSPIIIKGLTNGVLYTFTVRALNIYGKGSDSLPSSAITLIESQQEPTGLAGVAPSIYGASDGKITGTTSEMEYKLSTESTWIKVTGTEITGLIAGTYNVRYAAKEGLNEGIAVDVVVPDGQNANQEAPAGLAGVAPSIYGASDGKITETTSEMEYKLSTESTWIKVTGIEITGLIAGTYNVRYAAKEGLNAGAAVDVVVPDGQNANQEAPTGLAGVAPSIYGASDGKITGTTSEMEYKLSTESTWIKVTGTEITGLIAGTYNVRYAAKEGLNAGTAVDVVMPDGENANQSAPTGFAGVAPSIYGASDGKITGTTSEMEYKLSTESTWIKVTGIEITGLIAGTYNVRYAAKEGLNAGTAVDIVVSDGPNANQSAPTGLAGVTPSNYGVSDGKITGTTGEMEYKLSTESTWTKVTGTEITGLASGIYNVRYAAKEGLNAGTAVDVVVAAYIKQEQPSSGASSNVTPPKPINKTVDGSVVDNISYKQVSKITATATTDNNGYYTISMKTADAVRLMQPDGSIKELSDISKVYITNESGSPVTIFTDGTLEIKKLSKGTNYDFNIAFDLGNGQKINISTINIKIANNGDVNLTSTLIDPYGEIIDAATGKVIVGVNVKLYYANTQRNIASGKKPDTLVALPIIDGFKPNDNRNSQVSDKNGAYGFMVFPTTDYYIVLSKDGYDELKSPTIFVEQSIVNLNFKMNKPDKGIKRIYGSNRIDTALEIAKASYKEKLSNVVLVSAEGYYDALTGSVLAYKLNAPILLVGSSAAEQKKVLSYMKENMDINGTVYILGGTGVISTSVEEKIIGSGFKKIKRLVGKDRYETSLKIAEQLDTKMGTPIVIVSGEDYPDALAISNVAAIMQYPIFLVKKNGISDAIKEKIAQLKPTKVYIISTQGGISEAVEEQITGISKENIIRIGGSDRYKTSLAVAKHFNLSGYRICVATGRDFPDALTGSVYAANVNAPIILVSSRLSDDMIKYLKNRKIKGVTIFGGDGVVSKDIYKQLNQLIGK